MCNDYRLLVDIASIIEDFADLKIKVRMPEGTPNVAARDDIRISDSAPIVRRAGTRDEVELVNRRWSWPGPSGRPVYNFRAEDRSFEHGRCLILADGFYEFTEAQAGEKRKTKWLFTLEDHDWFGIAGLWRDHAEVGEAFTMLTIAPGEDVAPYHDRQIVPLPRERWADWLDPDVPAAEMLTALPKGSLAVRQVFPPLPAQGAML